MFGLRRQPSLEAFIFLWLCFSYRTFFLSKNINFFKNFNHYQRLKEEKKKFQTNMEFKNLKRFKILVYFGFATSKTVLDNC